MTSLGRSIGLFGVLFCLLSSRGSAYPIYVDDDAPLGGAGVDWPSAHRYLQDALLHAASTPAVTEILIAEGVYRPDLDEAGEVTVGDRNASFKLVGGVAMRGGYLGLSGADWFARDIVAYATILSGDLGENDKPDFQNYADNSYHVVRFETTGPMPFLDGITITAGNANGSWPNNIAAALYSESNSIAFLDCSFVANRATLFGGAIYLSQASPVFDGCRFTDNWAGSGGGIYAAANSRPTLHGCEFVNNGGRALVNASGSNTHSVLCVFRQNYSADVGGAVRNELSSPTFDRCVFVGNRTTGVNKIGGAVDNWESDPRFTGCRFLGNLSQAGGAVFERSNSEATYTSCVFSGNRCNTAGGAVYCGEGASPEFRQCTFSQNLAGTSGTGQGGGLYLGFVNAGVQLSGCILWGNSAAGDIGETGQIGGYAPDSVKYSCIQGLDRFSDATNIDLDPVFNDVLGADGTVGTEDDDLGLANASPCINSGPYDTAGLGEEDAGAQERVQHCRVDMGAYESPYPSAHPLDCNINGADDDCDVAGGASHDCNENHTPDECDGDCNANAFADECDLAGGTSLDCQGNGVPDECDVDCNANGAPDDCELAAGTSADCNTNGVPDECDVAAGTSDDCNTNGVPDPCDSDFDEDGVPDDCDDDADGDGVQNDVDACRYSQPGAEVNPYGGPMGDLTGDCRVGLADYMFFEACLHLSGPGGAPGVDECHAVMDFDADLDVDLVDFAAFQAALADPQSAE